MTAPAGGQASGYQVPGYRAPGGQASGDRGAGPSDRLEVYRLALAESRAGFADLMAQPEKIRRNVSALLGLAAVAATIIGAVPAATSSEQPGPVAQLSAIADAGPVIDVVTAVMTVLGIAGLVVCTAVVMAPKKLVPSMKADDIVGWGDAGDSLATAMKSLVLGTEENYRTNAKVIKIMFRWQIGAIVCFGVIVLALGARL